MISLKKNKIYFLPFLSIDETLLSIRSTMDKDNSAIDNLNHHKLLVIDLKDFGRKDVWKYNDWMDDLAIVT